MASSKDKPKHLSELLPVLEGRASAGAAAWKAYIEKNALPGETLSLSVRQWACPECGTRHDRDVNAALNLKNLAVSSTVSACGEESAGLNRKIQVKLASVKQEVSSKST